jgi:hypothetical protein
MGILPTITDGLKMPGMCNCKSCINCKLARKPVTPTTSRASQLLQLVPSNI